MGVHQGNQHLTVFVSGETGGVTLAVGATLAAGKFSFVAVGTGVGTATPPAVPFQVAYAYPDGDVLRSATMNSALGPITGAAPTAKVQTLTLPGIAVAGALDYTVRLALPAYGGTISQQDEVFVYGNYKAAVGATATTISTGLRASLNKGLAKMPEQVVVLSGTASIVATGVTQSYVNNKFAGDQQDFDISLTGAVDVAPVNTTSPKPGKGVGNQVASMEEFFAGYNSDNINRDRNWPVGGNPQLVADVTKKYSSISCVGGDVFGGSMPVMQRKSVVVFFNPTGI